jgi:hypothetical protein
MRGLIARTATLLAALTLVAAGAAPAATASQRFTTVSVGMFRGCGLTDQGRAYCWGQNDVGQLGDGTVENSVGNGPQAVIGGLKFTSISARYTVTCALTARGRAYCWGANGVGQLGDGTTDNSNENGPQAVIGGHKFTSISAGASHACGLTAQGRAYCWGNNYQGALGDGTTANSDRNGPQAVIGGLRFASISAGLSRTCGITIQGRAYCWGSNSDGAFGNGTNISSLESGPQAVIGGLRFASISTGAFHTCALTDRGKAYCWGSNGEGTLGDGSSPNRSANSPQAVIGGLKFSSISTGFTRTCGITVRGDAYCWGNNGTGQLGDGTGNGSNSLGPRAVIGGLKFASISAGWKHVCGSTTQGRAYCWGLDAGTGALGGGDVDGTYGRGPLAVQ